METKGADPDLTGYEKWDQEKEMLENNNLIPDIKNLTGCVGINDMNIIDMNFMKRHNEAGVTGSGLYYGLDEDGNLRRE